MTRTSSDRVRYCTSQNECVDCHADNKVKAAQHLQVRGKLRAPCCKAHFYAYKNKINKANAKKYARRSAARRKAGLCVSPGCHNKLIPQELLPPWVRESTCGMHRPFRALPANRTAILRFIIEHCLSDEERKGAAQNIIYKRRLRVILFSAQHPGYYHTKVFSARDLLRRYKQVYQS